MIRLGPVLLLVAVALAACGGDGSGDGGAPPASVESITEPAGVVLEGETLAGERLSLADLRGTPVFVNVWASW